MRRRSAPRAILTLGVIALLGLAACRNGGGAGGVTDWFSAELRALEKEELRVKSELGGFPELYPDQQTERIGYASRPVKPRRQDRSRPGVARQPETRYIRLDLGAVRQIDRVVLVPADFAVDAAAGAGYGFPVRWRIEVADEANFENPVVLADQTGEDFPNPGLWPVSVVPAEPVRARFVRLTAVRLWRRHELSLLALGEIMVLQGKRNLAAGLPREALKVTDSDEERRNWSVANLVDSQSVLGAPSGILTSVTSGYHSLQERHPDEEKWVQVDLGQSLPLQEVRLYPARSTDYPSRRGFGFPLRWRLEASVDESFTRPIPINDFSRNDFRNPNENPVVEPVPPITARYVRMTAMKRQGRANDSGIALAEMEVYSGGENVAAGARVTAQDSRENERWSARFLTDGFNSQRQLTDWPAYLDGLEERRQREHILAEVPQRRAGLTRKVLRQISGWAVGLSGLAALGLGWAARRNRRERRQEMEALRQRIARDVHDEIGSGLGTIALLSQMAGAKGSHPEEARQDFSEINHLSREITESLRDIVWLIRPETRTLGDLAQRLRETAASMLAAVPHEFTVDPGVQGRQLPLEFKRQILLVFKEALHNLMRHAAATHAVVRVGGDAERFLLELSDDGRGFDPAVPVSGAGLTGMRQRAATLGGALEMHAAPGKGTRLRLAVPWPRAA